MGKYSVVCRLCGFSYEQITGKHLQSAHGVDTVSEYESMFPGAEIYSESVLDSMSSWQEDATERNEAISVALTGRDITWGDLISEEKSGVPSTRTSEEFSNTTKELWRQPGYRERLSRVHKQLWTDPEFKESQIRQMKSGAGGLHPNYSEMWLGDLLGLVSPGVWKFNEGELVIAGMVPDFIRTDEVKDCIELFGDYWHKGEPVEGRLYLYEKAGYRCLGLWEHELGLRRGTTVNGLDLLARLKVFSVNGAPSGN